MNIEQQLESAIKEYNKNNGIAFSVGLVKRTVTHIMGNYEVDKIKTQEELDDFIDSDVIANVIDFFWKDYLDE